MRQKLNGYQACKLFMNIRNHFKSEKFDVFVSTGIRYTEANFEKRPDKGYFYKLADDYAKGDLGYFFMSNLLAHANHPSEMTDGNYREYKSKMHKLEKIFEDDCKTIQVYAIEHNVEFKAFFSSSTGGIPLSIQMLNGNLINLETICLMNLVLKDTLINKMDNEIRDKFIWPDIRLRIIKYTPFMSRYYDEIKIKNILKQFI